MIDEKHITTMCHGQLYQCHIDWAFNKKVRPRVFEEGSLVFRKHNQVMPDHRGKFALTNEGPYMVKKAFSGGALILANMDGYDFNMPTNSNVVIQYFAWGGLQVQPPFFTFLCTKYIYIYIWKGRLKTRKCDLCKRSVKERVRGNLLDWKPKRAIWAKIKAIKNVSWTTWWLDPSPLRYVGSQLLPLWEWERFV